MKGKRTLKSLTEAASDVVASGKIEASVMMTKINKNLAAYNDLAKDLGFLFNDLQSLILKERVVKRHANAICAKFWCQQAR